MDEKTRLETLLSKLEEDFERVRKPVVALYPYDRETQTISLPEAIETELTPPMDPARTKAEGRKTRYGAQGAPDRRRSTIGQNVRRWSGR